MKAGGVTEVTVAVNSDNNFYTSLSLWDNLPKHYSQTLELNNVVEICKFSSAKFPIIATELKHIKIEKQTLIKKLTNVDILKQFENLSIQSIEKTIEGKLAAMRQPMLFESCKCGKKVEKGQRNCR